MNPPESGPGQLFKPSRTLLTFGKNKLGGKLGFIAILHTWDQRLNAHFHLHCLVAGEAVSEDWAQWIPCDSYLFNEEALSLVFRGKFMEQMTRIILHGKLPFAGTYQQLKLPAASCRECARCCGSKFQGLAVCPD
ncbi:MAG: transposase, partial [Desulfobacterales bacterium]